MKFSDEATARTYSDRSVDPSWIEWCRETIAPEDLTVVDIGCGGGIYSKGFLKCGAKRVIGVDASEQYIDEARNACPDGEFHVAPCDCTGIPDGSADVVFERALIHHLSFDQQTANALEMFRILRQSGSAVIQDRTIDDVVAQHDQFWIRRELMRMFPRLFDYEAKRRPDREAYARILSATGFTAVTASSYAEVRRKYSSPQALDEELKRRKGKSILFELTDDELYAYRKRIRQLCPEAGIVECDRWTVWKASKAI
jgi:ubiquinone/menaquinone biosynthesis C-methylase UbiE